MQSALDCSQVMLLPTDFEMLFFSYFPRFKKGLYYGFPKEVGFKIELLL